MADGNRDPDGGVVPPGGPARIDVRPSQEEDRAAPELDEGAAARTERVAAAERYYQQGHRESRTAALIVSVLSVIFVIMLLAYLFYSARLHAAFFESVGSWQTQSPAEAIHPSQMEMEYMRTKAARVGFALLYRFSLSSAAIVVSLATIVLGSVLIFDRVAASTASSLVVEPGKENWRVSLASTFPGLIMVAIGAMTLAYSVYLAGPGAPTIEVTDVPLYVPDENYARQVRSRLAVVGAPSPDIEGDVPVGLTFQPIGEGGGSADAGADGTE